MDNTFLIFGVLINLILSFVVANIADQKGRSFAGFFWLSFLFSFFIGLLVVIASPAVQNNATTRDSTEIRTKCPYCAEEILAEASVCKHCGRDVSPRIDLITAAEEQKSVCAREVANAKSKTQIQNKRDNRIALAVTFYIIGAGTLFLTIAVGGNSASALVVTGVLTFLFLIFGTMSLISMPPKRGTADLKKAKRLLSKGN